jgi:hypothetical protein
VPENWFEMLVGTLAGIAGWVWVQQTRKIEQLERRIGDIEHNYIDRFEAVTREIRDTKDIVVSKINDLHILVTGNFVKKDECARFLGEKEPFSK